MGNKSFHRGQPIKRDAKISTTEFASHLHSSVIQFEMRFACPTTTKVEMDPMNIFDYEIFFLYLSLFLMIITCLNTHNLR